MNNLTYQNRNNQQQLFVEKTPIIDIAQQVGTPFYCYSKKALVDNFLQFDQAFKDNSIEACFSHMLYCMAMSNYDLKNLNNEICRVLKPGGINIYSVRHTEDGDYKNGIFRGEDLYENNGFIVNFFSIDKINKLTKGFKILEIEKFEEGKFPRKLFLVKNVKL